MMSADAVTENNTNFTLFWVGMPGDSLSTAPDRKKDLKEFSVAASD